MNTNKAKASDYGIHPQMPIIPDTMVSLAQYARKLQVELVFQSVNSGERIPAETRFLRIADEMGGLDPDFVARLVDQGEAIIWDRELAEMTDEQREAYLRPYVDPTYDVYAELTDEQRELADEFVAGLGEALDEAIQARNEIDELNGWLDL